MPIQWTALYKDGTSLPQFNDGSENRYADIDRSRLAAFAILRDDKPLFCLHLDPGARLIYRRRVEQVAGGGQIVVYIVGSQQTIAGVNFQSIAYVSDAGEVHLAGSWRDDHPWFYAVQPVPCESESST